MSRVSLKLATVFLSTLLAACGGGGGGGDSATATSNGQTSNGTGTPTTPGEGTTPPDNPTGDVTPPDEPFTASLSTAPANGATLAGTVTLEVQGSAIENVELLPPDGYSPRLGVFTIAPDKRRATLVFDTRSLPNGTLLARVSVYNRPAGSADATEIVAMPTRTWQLRNDPPPAPATIPPASYMPEVHISGLNLPYVDPEPLRTMMAMDDAAYESMLANEWPRVQGVMHQYIPPHVVLMPPTPLGFSGPWYSCLDTHGRLACREAMNSMIGLMSSKAPVS
ncbi:hypothetical protein [Noviherbaspirillum agri]